MMVAKSRPIPGSTGEVLTELPSPYLPDPVFGLLHLPRFVAKIRYVALNGALPPSYRKNYKRGFDRFLCMHLGVEPDAVEACVNGAGQGESPFERLRSIFPRDVAAHRWNRSIVQKGMTDAGREFIRESLEKMGCLDRAEEILSVADMIELDEGRVD